MVNFGDIVRRFSVHLGLLCCLHVFKPFLVLSSCSAFRPQECQYILVLVLVLLSCLSPSLILLSSRMLYDIED